VAVQAAPTVTTENFNELGGSAYQHQPNNSALQGLPTGISATFSANCQLMWSPGVNPPNSTATNNVEVGWTPATMVTFSKPVVLWSVAVFKKWTNTVTVIGKRSGVQVWSYTNSDAISGSWFSLNRGAGRIIDQLDVNCDSWGVKFTDFCLSDAAGFSAFTNSLPYYVDGTNALASDYNPGTQALPWKTIQWAANYLQAGDTVYIKAGTYTGDVSAGNSGNAAGWITYSAYPGQEQQAVLNGGEFDVNQRSYIRISGLRIQNVNGAGIYVTGPGANYIISSNYIYNTTQSGIAVWGVPWTWDPGVYDYRAITNVVVEGNTIEMACNGGYNEQLDICNGVDGFEVRNNIIKNGINAVNGGEGIDCKEGAGNGKIWGNQIFNIRRYAMYLEAGASDPAYYKIRSGVLTNLLVFNNVIHNNDSHGIGITSEGRGNINGIKLYNNLCYSNGADGILLYDYGYTNGQTGNYASNITIINNTTYNNNTSTQYPWYGGIATDHKYARNVLVRNNIAYETLQGAFGVKQPFNPATVQDHNISTAYNPGFVSVAGADFHLISGSSAINAGSASGAPLVDFDGSVRPYGSGFDIGAFEYIPASPFSLSIQCPPSLAAATLNFQGGPESHYRVEWKSAVGNGAWTPLQDIPSLPRCPYTLCDTNLAAAPQRFYRAVLLTP
jgi:hypothetical protein